MILRLLGLIAVLCLTGVQSAMAALSSPSATSDTTNLYYRFVYSGTPNFFRAFLDTDKSASTGYSFNGIGANYLLENGNLYRYSGSNGAWGWTRLKTVSMTKTSSTIQWTVAKVDVGSPAGVNLFLQHDNPVVTSAMIAQTVTVATSNSITLTVAGAPNLPYNGTSTSVRVTFVGATPSKVSLARDGLAAFATWPGGTFFTLSSDGKSISGNWCISASCWGNQPGSHFLTATAIYADGSTKSSSVTLNVSDSVTTTTLRPTTTTTLPPPPTTTLPPPPTTTTLPPTSSGPTYYISPTGNDANAGTSSSPWRTIKKAADTVSAGATVILMNGSYEEPEIAFRRSGTASAPITIKAQNKWLAIVNSVSGCHPAFSMYASHIHVRDLRFSVSSRNANCSTYTSANVHIRAWEGRLATPSSPTTGYVGFRASGLKIDGLNRAIGIKSNQDLTIIENSEAAHSLELFGSRDSIIRNNLVVGPGASDPAIFVKGGVRNVQIYNNVVRMTRANRNAILIGGYSCDACHFDTSTNIEAYNTVAYNNVVINESGGQISALGFQGAKDSAFFNNVVIGGTFSMLAGGHNTGPQAPVSNPTFKNNIVVCNGALTSGYFGWSYSGTLNADYNNFYNCSSSITQAHPIVGNPMFVNQTSDWRLQAGSPAINSGVPVSMPAYGGGTIDISRDFNGVTRTAPWDLGIYNTP